MGKMEVPNEMWAKRPFGQLDKCVEAAALRKAFPEELGNTYTVDEMEGRTIEGSLADTAEERPVPPKPPVKVLKLSEPPVSSVQRMKASDLAPPKPPAKEPDQELWEPGEDTVSPGELLSDLDNALATAKTVEEVDEIYDAHDLEAALESVSGGADFQSVALGIKRRHLKRMTS
jgi:hypothetical protein